MYHIGLYSIKLKLVLFKYRINMIGGICMKLVSACLCGFNCKYNGDNNFNPYFAELLDNDEVIPVCPEEMAGLPTPRTSCEIIGGTGLDVLDGKARVVTKDGVDITDILIEGAQSILFIAIQSGADGAIFKCNSPSCGHGKIYDGTFTGKLIDGDGVAAALLKQHDIKVWSDQEYLDEKGVSTSIESN
jgi:uncharacterized protein YbbK (DUF523 family)